MGFDGLEIETERTKYIHITFSRARRGHRMNFFVCLGQVDKEILPFMKLCTAYKYWKLKKNQIL